MKNCKRCGRTLYKNRCIAKDCFDPNDGLIKNLDKIVGIKKIKKAKQ